MKNIFIGIALALVVIVLVIVLFARGGDEPMVTFTPSPTISPTLLPSPTATPTATASTVAIVYTDAGYVPATVTIAAGTTVVFQNNSTKEMWPASGVHPTHNVYPERGNCFADVFTGCEIAPGGTFSMKFNVVGTWQYHNHRNPSSTGTIIVTQ